MDSPAPRKWIERGKPNGFANYGPESCLQIAYISWLNLQHRLVAQTTLAIPNGGKRSWNEGRRLKQMGLLPGVPDILMCYPVPPYPGFFLELKVGDNKIDENQYYMICRFMKVGYVCAICYTLDESMEATNQYLQGKGQDVQRRTIAALNNTPYAKRARTE